MTACAAVPPPGSGPLIGNWGGQHVGLTLDQSGGTIEYDCAAGRITGGVFPGRDGRFVATGTHTPNSGGPERLGEVRRAYPARYSGSVSGEWMALRIDVPDRGLVIGPYRLRRGAQPMLLRCL